MFKIILVLLKMQLLLPVFTMGILVSKLNPVAQINTLSQRQIKNCITAILDWQSLAKYLQFRTFCFVMLIFESVISLF